MSHQRILVLTLSFGSGHVRAAEVVASELREIAPNAEVRVMDALEDARPFFRLLYVAPYWVMVRYAPALWRWFFGRRVARKVEATAPAWAFRKGCPRVFDEIKEWQPHAIVACEVAACEMAAIAVRCGLTNAKVVAVITDHEAEPVWVKREVRAYAVSNESVREELRAWGTSIERIETCGIPIDGRFTLPRDAAEIATIRRRFHLRTDVPLVLLMGGGMGPTRMDKVAESLCRQNKDRGFDILAITGHDRRAFHRLERLRKRFETEQDAVQKTQVALRVIGWTDAIAELMRAADVLVTKPGGMTTSEAAACALPSILFDAIPGPELRNAQYMMEAGAGIMTCGSHLTAAAIVSLLEDEHQRSRMSASASRLSKPDAAPRVASLVLETMNGREFGASSAMRTTRRRTA
jgi:processive 1,2-diacylglycerol beta-glucosyltransferase